MKTQKEAVLTVRDEAGCLVAIVSTEERHQTFHSVARLDQEGIESLMNKVYAERPIVRGNVPDSKGTVHITI